MLVHTVLIRFKHGVPDTKREELYNLYQTLGEECGGVKAGILFWRVAHSLDDRKAHLVELAFFADDAALQEFRFHPKHVELTHLAREIADWWVGDFMEDALVVPV